MTPMQTFWLLGSFTKNPYLRVTGLNPLKREIKIDFGQPWDR